MKVFQDLFVTIPDDRITEILELIFSNLPLGWTRDLEGEKKLHEDVDKEFYLFICDKQEEREKARIVFFQKENNTYYVSNIIPLGPDVNELTEDQYNKILNDFYQYCLQPHEASLSLNITMTKDNLTLNGLVSNESASKLLAFSQAANKSTGNSHPSDKARWYDFIKSIVSQGDNLTPDKLFKWLVEDENWRPDIADKLVIEYENEVGLLKSLYKSI